MRKLTSLGIIPARAGSKRLPGKHLMPLGGKRLIDWTIEAALDSTLDSVFLSTDDSEIIAHATRTYQDTRLSYIPRPGRLATDSVHAVEVVLDILARMPGAEVPDITCMLLPTCPFRSSLHINNAVQFVATHGGAVVGVEHLDYPAIRLRHIKQPSGVLVSVLGTTANVTQNSQQCEPLYRVNGAIFCARTVLLLGNRTFHIMHRTEPIIMSADESIDIDTARDYERALDVVHRRVKYPTLKDG